VGGRGGVLRVLEGHEVHAGGIARGARDVDVARRVQRDAGRLVVAGGRSVEADRPPPDAGRVDLDRPVVEGGAVAGIAGQVGVAGGVQPELVGTLEGARGTVVVGAPLRAARGVVLHEGEVLAGAGHGRRAGHVDVAGGVEGEVGGLVGAVGGAVVRDRPLLRAARVVLHGD